MDVIRQWTFSICAALVVCAILRLLTPKGNMKSVYGLTLSVFVLCALLSPFFLARPELRLELQTQSEEEIGRRAQSLTDAVTRQSEQAASAELQKIVSSALEEMGINYREITIHINIKGQNDGEEAAVAELVLDERHTDERESIRQRLLERLEIPFTLTFR